MFLVIIDTILTTDYGCNEVYGFHEHQDLYLNTRKGEMATNAVGDIGRWYDWEETYRSIMLPRFLFLCYIAERSV